MTTSFPSPASSSILLLNGPDNPRVLAIAGGESGSNKQQSAPPVADLTAAAGAVCSTGLRVFSDFTPMPRNPTHADTARMMNFVSVVVAFLNALERDLSRMSGGEDGYLGSSDGAEDAWNAAFVEPVTRAASKLAEVRDGLAAQTLRNTGWAGAA